MKNKGQNTYYTFFLFFFYSAIFSSDRACFLDNLTAICSESQRVLFLVWNCGVWGGDVFPPKNCLKLKWSPQEVIYMTLELHMKCSEHMPLPGNANNFLPGLFQLLKVLWGRPQPLSPPHGSVPSHSGSFWFVKWHFLITICRGKEFIWKNPDPNGQIYHVVQP